MPTGYDGSKASMIGKGILMVEDMRSDEAMKLAIEQLRKANRPGPYYLPIEREDTILLFCDACFEGTGPCPKCMADMRARQKRPASSSTGSGTSGSGIHHGSRDFSSGFPRRQWPGVHEPIDAREWLAFAWARNRPPEQGLPVFDI